MSIDALLHSIIIQAAALYLCLDKGRLQTSYRYDLICIITLDCVNVLLISVSLIQ